MAGKHKEPKEFSGNRDQLLQFIKTAKESGCEQSEAAFDKALGKIAKAPAPKGTK